MLSEMEQVVTKMLFESYGVGKYCDSHIGSITYLLRFNGYRVPGFNDTTVAAQTHTDKSFLTVLDQNQVNGLEVKLKDDQFVAIDFLPSTFVVMAGDGLLVGHPNSCFQLLETVLEELKMLVIYVHSVYANNKKYNYLYKL